LQPEKIKRIYKILALLKEKNIGAFQKNRRIWKILALLQKSGGFENYWRFSKNQADLENNGAFQKNRRIYKMLAPCRKQADDRI
jgi:hypothetical protein